MAKDKNVLLDSPEERVTNGSLGTLLDAADVQDKKVEKLDAMFDQMQEFYQKGEYEQVLKITEEAMKLDPSNGNLVLLMGLVNRDMGKKIQAVHWLRKALNDFGMAEAEISLMELYQSGIAGADYKKKAEEYFAKTGNAAPAAEVKAAKEEAKPTGSAVQPKATVHKAETKPEEKPVAVAKKEKDLCTYPAPGTPLYTVEEYQEFVKNHPNMSEDQRLKLAEQQGRGFGYLYMSTAKAQIELNDRQYWRPWNEIMQHASTSGDAKKTVSTWKDVHNFARQGIVTTLNDYVEKRGRKIDCWPTSESGSGFSIFTSQGRMDGKYLRPFSYFSDDYGMTLNNGKVTMNENAVRTSSSMFKLKPKELKKPDELEKLEKKIAELEKVPVYTEKQKKYSQRCAVLSLLPLLYLLFNVVVLYGSLTGKEMFGLVAIANFVTLKIDGLWESGIIGKIVAFVPMFVGIAVGGAMMLVYGIAHIFGWDLAAAIILTIVSLILGVFAQEWCMKNLFDCEEFISSKDVKKGNDAKAELERLSNSEELNRLREDYKASSEKHVKDFKELSEQWQLKWYEACKRG
ncbi:MAG: hypothetical protein IJ374_10545 [Lachnospiraceae bacterium]|nr:hypothetical protein [Lachnospiraceae bacterium]